MEKSPLEKESIDNKDILLNYAITINLTFVLCSPPLRSCGRVGIDVCRYWTSPVCNLLILRNELVSLFCCTIQWDTSFGNHSFPALSNA
ncbi:hypothetical protein JTB14_009233 [Gonioctena quinquepunctata]|nr:hypothetical protein JTB14_009233 [Gonioctena quinquepunctata]